MLRLSLGLFSLFFSYNNAQTNTSTGCTTSVCVFANSYLRFGTGSENSVNSQGLFVQPWYFSETSNVWYKLTFASYPLDTAIGTGTGSTQWSGATVYDIYSLPNTGPVTDYSNFVVTSTDSTKTVGYGVIIANRTLTIGSTSFVFQNIFSLGQNDKFVKIITSIINFSPYDLNNLIIWTGTRDDYVGSTDVNSKTRGNLNTGSFVPITAVGQSSRAILISNTVEGVLFYSETTGVMTSFSSCCAFSNAYNTNPNTLAIATTSPTDGSYSAVLPLGNLLSGQSARITWYYAAGTISSISSVAQSVAAAQVADAGVPELSMTSSVSISASEAFTNTPVYSTTLVNSWSSSPEFSSSIVNTFSSWNSPSLLSSMTENVTESTSSTFSSWYSPSVLSSMTENITASTSSTFSSIPSISANLSASTSSSYTSTSSSTPSLTPTPSSTSSFPIRVILVPHNDTPHTSITSVYVSTDSLPTAITMYVILGVNVAFVCGCLCCSVFIICLIKRVHNDKRNTMIVRTVV
jgi:hypothetical protein